MTRCKNCPNRDRETCGFEESDTPRPLLALLGESPGWQDLKEQRPLSPRSAAGRLLHETMQSLDLARSDCYVANAANCATRTGRELDKAQPACQGRLLEDLAELPASTVIVPLGSAALKSVLSKRSAAILKYRGSVTRLTDGPLAGRLVVPSVHPALALKKPAFQEVLRRDLARALMVQEHGFTPPELAAGRETHICRDVDELEFRLSKLGDEVSFDVETTVDSPLFNALICYAVSDGAQTLVVPWSSFRSGDGCVWADPALVGRLTSEAFEQRLVVGHNLPGFDALVAERYGIRFSRVADTLIGFHSCHGELPKNLGFVASYYLSVAAWKQQEDLGADLPRLYAYNGRDALYTILTWFELKRELGL